MVTQKREVYFFIAGCFLILSVLLFCCSLEEKAKSDLGSVGLNKVTITPNNSINEAAISGNDIKELKNYLNTDIVGFSASIKSQVSSQSTSVKARVLGINDGYTAFADFQMKQGSFFSAADDMESSRVAVIDEVLAWKLFNNDHVVGTQIDALGSRFKVIGVLKSDDSVISRLMYDGIYNVYIPYGAYHQCAPDGNIDYAQFKTGSGSLMEKNTDEMRRALQSVGKNAENYQINDCKLTQTLIFQQYHIFVFVMGIFIAGFVVLVYKKRCVHMLRELKSQAAQGYFTDVLKIHRMGLAALLLQLVFVFGCLFVIWRLIAFDPFIPAWLISDDLTDVSYFVRLFQEHWVQNAASADILPAYGQVRPEVLQNTFNIIFYSGSILGTLLIYLGRPVFDKPDRSAVAPVVLSGLLIAVLIAMLTIFELLLGMPAAVNIQGIIIFWAFIYTAVIYRANAGQCESQAEEEVGA